MKSRKRITVIDREMDDVFGWRLLLYVVGKIMKIMKIRELFPTPGTHVASYVKAGIFPSIHSLWK